MSVCLAIPIPKCRDRERVIAIRVDVVRRWMAGPGVRFVAHGALIVIHNLGAAS